MQAKIKRTNLNKKDQARNMRGVRKYNDKINFIVANNIKIDAVDNKKTLKEIKGDKEFKLQIEERKKRNFASREEISNENEDIIKTETGSDIENSEEKQNNNFDESLFDDENEVKLEANKPPYKPVLPMNEYKDFKFEILFENERIMIINKWPGIMVHPDDRNVEITLSDIIYEKYPEIREVGEWGRPGIVHRLDRNTTGVLIICKTADSYKDMKNIFREHKIRKVYRAIVEGNVRDDMGIIDKPIARSRSDFRKKSVMDMYSKDFRGEERSAITRYKVLARSEDKKFTYVELYPLTGRTHQLRVHMRAIRHPIVGDDLYGSVKGATLAPRSMLHAYKIEFTLRKQEIKVESKIPDDMKIEVDKYFKIC